MQQTGIKSTILRMGWHRDVPKMRMAPTKCNIYTNLFNEHDPWTNKRWINTRLVGTGWAGNWPLREGLTQEWWELDKQGIDQYEMDEQETAMRDEAADWQEMINGRWISRRLIKLDQQRFESLINRRLNGWGGGWTGDRSGKWNSKRWQEANG